MNRPEQGRSLWWERHAAAFIADHPLAAVNWKLHTDDMKARRNAAIQRSIETGLEYSEEPLSPEDEEQLAAPPEDYEQTLF